VGTCRNFGLLAARGDSLVHIWKTFDTPFFDLCLITDFVFSFNFTTIVLLERKPDGPEGSFGPNDAVVIWVDSCNPSLI
jgi:hypothetical protein